VDVSALPRLLVRPGRTFEQLWHHTGPLQGGIVALLLILAGTLVEVLLKWVVPGYGSSEVATLRGLLAPWTGFVMAFLGFLFMSALVHGLVRSGGDARKPDLGMTVGLMGYAMFPVLVLGMALTVVSAYYGGEIDRFTEETGGLAEDWGGWTEYRVVYYVLLIVMVLWGVRIQAKAVGVANDSAGGRTLGLVLVAWAVGFIVWLALLQVWFLVTEGEWVDVPWLPLV
jgi:hypothetical protein